MILIIFLIPPVGAYSVGQAQAQSKSHFLLRKMVVMYQLVNYDLLAYPIKNKGGEEGTVPSAPGTVPSNSTEILIATKCKTMIRKMKIKFIADQVFFIHFGSLTD